MNFLVHEIYAYRAHIGHCIFSEHMGGPDGLWSTQNVGWVSQNAFGPANDWPVCSLVVDL